MIGGGGMMLSGGDGEGDGDGDASLRCVGLDFGSCGLVGRDMVLFYSYEAELICSLLSVLTTV